jgi:hypothetical protein
MTWGICALPWDLSCYSPDGSYADRLMHQGGFLAYLQENNLIPPSTNSLTYPFYSSLVYSDSIPLFGIISKLFLYKKVFNFQFFGIASLIFTFLNGYFAFEFCKRLKISFIGSLVTSTFIQLAPISIIRGLDHEALSAQFLLIGIMQLSTYSSLRIKSTIYWPALLFISLGIHAYFAYFLIFFQYSKLSLDLIINYLIVRKEKYQKRNLNIIKFSFKIISINIFLTLIITLICFFLYGYGFGTVDPGDIAWNASIHGFWDPNPTLNYLFDFHNVNLTYPFSFSFPRTPFQHEGFAYIGFPLITWSIFLFLISRKNFPYKKIKTSRENSFALTNLYLIAVCTILFLMALYTPGFHLADYFMKIFALGIRANGRLIWPIYYLIIFYIFYLSDSIYFLNRKNRKIYFALFVTSLISFFSVSYPTLKGAQSMRQSYRKLSNEYVLSPEYKCFDKALKNKPKEFSKFVILFFPRAPEHYINWSLAPITFKYKANNFRIARFPEGYNYKTLSDFDISELLNFDDLQDEKFLLFFDGRYINNEDMLVELEKNLSQNKLNPKTEWGKCSQVEVYYRFISSI